MTAGLSGRSSDRILDPNLDMRPYEASLDNQQNTTSLGQDSIVYIHGPQFWFISIAIAIMMFLTNMEVPVVTTALVAITDELGGFDTVGWVVASYLLGYVAVIVIFAKFSDIFGRKLVFLLSTALFIIFSAACSASQTIVQLVVFRAFQGIGGGGCFSLCTIMIIEIVPPDKYTQYVSNISVVNALALLLGPIVGGAISSHASWRWIFIINVPIAVPVFVVAFLVIPRDFPHQSQPNHQPKGIKYLMAKSTLDRIDIPGTTLILLATLALTAIFEEADKQFPWRSAFVITLLTVSGLLWITLAFWERHVTLSNKRFQLVYGLSSLNAGVRLIPFTITIAFGSIFSSTIAGKLKVPPLYMLLTGSYLQMLRFALLGTLPTTPDIPARIYGFEVITGWGCGMSFSLLFVMIPFVNEKRYHAVGMGGGAQFRMMGSAMILAIATSVFNTYALPHLQAILGVSDSDSLILSGAALASLPRGLQEGVRKILAEGYNRQILVLCVSASLQIPSLLLMWKRKQMVI
ncbi:putative multidrug resistance protein fnx1 [Xylariaceae sp. FL0662B]|nr:putative multidrug resistance protein fnx1 [Xylariaceae sp. FL0662B]